MCRPGCPLLLAQQIQTDRARDDQARNGRGTQLARPLPTVRRPGRSRWRRGKEVAAGGTASASAVLTVLPGRLPTAG